METDPLASHVNKTLFLFDLRCTIRFYYSNSQTLTPSNKTWMHALQMTIAFSITDSDGGQTYSVSIPVKYYTLSHIWHNWVLMQSNFDHYCDDLCVCGLKREAKKGTYRGRNSVDQWSTAYCRMLLSTSSACPKIWHGFGEGKRFGSINNWKTNLWCFWVFSRTNLYIWWWVRKVREKIALSGFSWAWSRTVKVRLCMFWKFWWLYQFGGWHFCWPDWETGFGYISQHQPWSSELWWRSQARRSISISVRRLPHAVQLSCVPISQILPATIEDRTVPSGAGFLRHTQSVMIYFSEL